tara:strand:+ start:2385 stop:2936 length:552 start_codon:yes stop_codon:yes gene_type:complete
MDQNTSLFYPIVDYKLNKTQKKQLRSLLIEAFPKSVQKRLFESQIPSFRGIVKIFGSIVAHVGVTHRIVNVDDKTFEIFGIFDLCTRKIHRKKGLASNLMAWVHELAGKSGINHILLFADQKQRAFYQHLGYQSVTAKCRWLVMDGAKSHSISEKQMDETLMIRSEAVDIFSGKTIDLLGGIF